MGRSLWEQGSACDCPPHLPAAEGVKFICRSQGAPPSGSRLGHHSGEKASPGEKRKMGSPRAARVSGAAVRADDRNSLYL